MISLNLEKPKKIHFIGIGGVSMSGLAEILKRDGHTVTGSDAIASSATAHLEGKGIAISIPNAARNITGDMDLVVFTAAVKKDNPEYIAAAEKGIQLVERAALIGVMLEKYSNSICIAGTHGKTTATSLISEITLDAGLAPTIQIGGYLGRDGTNYHVGNSSYFVLESCEYNNSFHHFKPHIGVILNIEADHLEFFGDLNGVIASFKKFANNIRPGGVLIIQEGIPGFDDVVADLDCEVVTFGERYGDFWVRNVKYDGMGRPTFNIMSEKTKLANVSLPLPGDYNMLNALASFAVGFELGIEPDDIAHSLSCAKGVKRRFELKGTYNNAHIIDDYAHHPTEILKLLQAARKAVNEKGGRLFCLFQPHTFSRTKNLMDSFSNAFGDAHHVGLVPIFPSREAFDPSVSSLHLLEGIKANNISSNHFENFETARDYYVQKLLPGDMLITTGAGDVFIVGEMVLST